MASNQKPETPSQHVKVLTIGIARGTRIEAIKHCHMEKNCVTARASGDQPIQATEDRKNEDVERWDGLS